jgi:hypothetical protein
MPTSKELDLIADILTSPENARQTAEEVARLVLQEINLFRAATYKYNVVARMGSDYYVSYPVKTKPEAVQVARQIIRLHHPQRIAILPAGEVHRAPPGSTADWLWIGSNDMREMGK